MLDLLMLSARRVLLSEPAAMPSARVVLLSEPSVMLSPPRRVICTKRLPRVPLLCEQWSVDRMQAPCEERPTGWPIPARRGWGHDDGTRANIATQPHPLLETPEAALLSERCAN